MSPRDWDLELRPTCSAGAIIGRLLFAHLIFLLQLLLQSAIVPQTGTILAFPSETALVEGRAGRHNSKPRYFKAFSCHRPVFFPEIKGWNAARLREVA